MRVFKGIEYASEFREITVRSGETVEETITPKRWINLPEQGWYGADGHLHIPRPSQELDPLLCSWMQAEDLHVANMLQWGLASRFHNTIQHTHGSKGVYREGNTILASGQENPRTHVLGHTIILGANDPINFPENYMIYRLFWEEAKRQGALSGYAHGGVHGGAQNGLSIDLPHGLLNFIEVLQFEKTNYDVWYNCLNTGFRLTPIAGTDFPCGNLSLPGRERFYTRVEGEFTFPNWLEGVRKGRTFVTNGPILEFSIDGKEIGDEIVLDKPGPVRVRGRVRVDPTWDEIERIEVVENGLVLRTVKAEFDFDHTAHEASWLALRVTGTKKGEKGARPSLAHTGAIYLSMKGAPSLSEHPRAKHLARIWLARLQELEGRLAEQLDWMGLAVGSDPVDTATMRKNRAGLIQAIQEAKKRFEGQMR